MSTDDKTREITKVPDRDTRKLRLHVKRAENCLMKKTYRVVWGYPMKCIKALNMELKMMCVPKCVSHRASSAIEAYGHKAHKKNWPLMVNSYRH